MRYFMTVTVDRSVEEFTAAPRKLFIDGQWTEAASGKTFETPNPATGETLANVAEIAKGIKLGPGMEAGTQMGPLVSDEQLRRVTGFLESGVSDGATTVTGGGRFGDQGYFVEPTVITNTRPDMKIVREEIFGPVVVAEPFRSLDEIAAEANNSTYGLGAGIWTKDISKAHALA